MNLYFRSCLLLYNSVAWAINSIELINKGDFIKYKRENCKIFQKIIKHSSFDSTINNLHIYSTYLLQAKMWNTKRTRKSIGPEFDIYFNRPLLIKFRIHFIRTCHCHDKY